jgi:hypothetical protein
MARLGDWGWRMRFVKFGDEYVAASRIVGVKFRTVKEAAQSSPDPFKHGPRGKDTDLAIAEVTIEGRASDLPVRGDEAIEALRRFCDAEVVACCP